MKTESQELINTFKVQQNNKKLDEKNLNKGDIPKQQKKKKVKDDCDPGNQVLIDQKDKVIYLPGYMRIKVKNFISMDLDNLNAQLNVTLIFSIFFGNLPKQIIEILQNQVILHFQREEGIILTQVQDQERKLQNKIKVNKKTSQIQYTIRKKMNATVLCDVFWTPFDVIHPVLTINIRPIRFSLNKQWLIKVNLIDHPKNHYLKLSYNDGGAFGNFQLAQNLTRCFFSYKRVQNIEQFKMTSQQMWRVIQVQQRQKQKQVKQLMILPIKSQQQQNDIVDYILSKQNKKVQQFQYAHYDIPLYKFPYVSILTVFLPLLLLAIINLGIFFQTEILYDRIASISALMIAFVALVPTVRDQIPPTPDIVFIQYLVYSQTFTSLFAFIHTFQITHAESFQLQWKESGFFIASVIVTFLVTIIITILLLIHGFYWEPYYNQEPIAEEKQEKFNRKQWGSYCLTKMFSDVIKKSPLEQQFPKLISQIIEEGKGIDDCVQKFD